ncbi:hypothetical protein DEU56DRAFT_913583 [Suillus clintonianus]|uniref:uncharacterized protein n=1 Tax=Suillus clintonianus TaxID=1904413 RepID=UPI001B8603E2|nr:uncharacterized protein DEU56DRAFT_913583 [Suillus clintonianus]KAG2134803.1 hypothetical protein DEU56DRAFT_913583 [Suillus clintonianus]
MSLSSSTPKFRVAICGAGIGGLVLAITIGKFAGHSIHIDLYEAHEAITTAGAGVGISPRTLEVIKELGIYEEYSRVANKPSSSSLGPTLRRSNAPQGGVEWFRQKLTNAPSHIHRQHLVEILEQFLPSSCTLHFKKRLTRYDEQPSGSLILHFADDGTATTDLLIGADGIRSSARKTLFETLNRDVVDPTKIGHYIDPSWTGTLVYRAIIPAKKVSEIDPNNIALKDFTVFCGMGKNIITYPVAQGTQINVAAFVRDDQKAGTPFEGHWVTDVSCKELQELYQDFEPDVRNLLKCSETTSRWALHVVNELPLSANGRVALIGDACHAMTPYFGAGAGQAMEDAFVLGRLLAHPLTTLDNVPAALKAYQDVRLPFVQFLARESQRAGHMVDIEPPSTDEDNAHVQANLDTQKEKVLAQFDWASKGGAVAEWLEAERKFQESIGLTDGQYENGCIVDVVRTLSALNV